MYSGSHVADPNHEKNGIVGAKILVRKIYWDHASLIFDTTSTLFHDSSV